MITEYHIETWIAKNFTYKKAGNGRQLRINNPFTVDDNYHLWISLEITPLKKGPYKGKKDYWVNDFRPGMFHGSFVNFVKKYRNISYNKAVSEITGKTGGELKSFLKYQYNKSKEVKVEEEEVEEFINLPEGSSPFSDNKTHRLKQIALNYLNQRMINDELVEKYDLHYTLSTIVFPYYEYGVLVYWQQREILNKKFLFPDSEKTGLSKTDYVFGFDFVEPHSILIVVESIFNSMSVGDGCIASGGAVIAGKQKQKIIALRPKTIILSPDNDKAGIASLIKNYYELKGITIITYCLPPKGIKDWNEYEQKFGRGSSRIYIDSNYKILGLSEIIRFKTLIAT